MTKQPFLVYMTERTCVDAQEEAAVIPIRIRALEYRQGLLHQGNLAYAFYLRDRNAGIYLAEVSSNHELDALIKRDPLFPYCKISAMPVIDTEWLVREAQDYLGEEIIALDRLEHLVHPHQEIDEGAQYLLVTKEVVPFSPLLSTEVQEDIYRRTIISQDAHENRTLEFADHNPVGQQIGILIGCGTAEDILAHIQKCEVYPDTQVTFECLQTLKQAYARGNQRLFYLRRATVCSEVFEVAVCAHRDDAKTLADT